MNEKKLIKLLNSSNQYNFVAMDDKFSRYDAFDTKNGIMLEIKCRNKHYDDTLLERIKFDWNKKYARDNNLEFMYAVSMPYKKGHKVYLFDPIVMEDEDEYDFKWHTRKLPAQTEFARNEWIDKEVGYLNVKDALAVLIEKTTH
jgi:hypothetical protein